MDEMGRDRLIGSMKIFQGYGSSLQAEPGSREIAQVLLWWWIRWGERGTLGDSTPHGVDFRRRQVR